MNSLSTMFMFVMVMVFAIGYIQMLPVEECGPNEIAADCAPLRPCQPSCNEPNGMECPAGICDANSCVCKEGFVRDNNNNFQCIESKQCSIPATTPLPAPSPTTSSRCGPNEVERECALPLICQATCGNSNGTVCPLICDLNSCECKEGFIRQSEVDFTCIEPKQCSISATTLLPAPSPTTSSRCGPNEVERECALPLICQPTCDNSNGTVCPLICSLNSCECKEGFIRQSELDFTCVEQTQCSTTATTLPLLCGLNEIGSQCAQPPSCQPTCDNPNGTACALICNPTSCKCKEGFIRQSQYELTCIEQTQCSMFTTTPLVSCGANEVASQCAQLPACQPRCDNSSDTACPLDCLPNSCECKEGFIRRSQYDFMCIDQAQCAQTKPVTCGESEVHSWCANPCQPSCEVPDRQPCPTFQCTEGCACRQGYFRATNDTSSSCITCVQSIN